MKKILLGIIFASLFVFGALAQDYTLRESPNISSSILNAQSSARTDVVWTPLNITTNLDNLQAENGIPLTEYGEEINFAFYDGMPEIPDGPPWTPYPSDGRSFGVSALVDDLIICDIPGTVKQPYINIVPTMLGTCTFSSGENTQYIASLIDTYSYILLRWLDPTKPAKFMLTDKNGKTSTYTFINTHCAELQFLGSDSTNRQKPVIYFNLTGCNPITTDNIYITKNTLGAQIDSLTRYKGDTYKLTLKNPTESGTFEFFVKDKEIPVACSTEYPYIAMKLAKTTSREFMGNSKSFQQFSSFSVKVGNKTYTGSGSSWVDSVYDPEHEEKTYATVTGSYFTVSPYDDFTRVIPIFSTAGTNIKSISWFGKPVISGVTVIDMTIEKELQRYSNSELNMNCYEQTYANGKFYPKPGKKATLTTYFDIVDNNGQHIQYELDFNTEEVASYPADVTYPTDKFAAVLTVETPQTLETDGSYNADIFVNDTTYVTVSPTVTSLGKGPHGRNLYDITFTDFPVGKYTPNFGQDDASIGNSSVPKNPTYNLQPNKAAVASGSKQVDELFLALGLYSDGQEYSFYKYDSDTYYVAVPTTITDNPYSFNTFFYLSGTVSSIKLDGIQMKSEQSQINLDRMLNTPKTLSITTNDGKTYNRKIVFQRAFQGPSVSSIRKTSDTTLEIGITITPKDIWGYYLNPEDFGYYELSERAVSVTGLPRSNYEIVAHDYIDEYVIRIKNITKDINFKVSINQDGSIAYSPDRKTILYTKKESRRDSMSVYEIYNTADVTYNISYDDFRNMDLYKGMYLCGTNMNNMNRTEAYCYVYGLDTLSYDDINVKTWQYNSGLVAIDKIYDNFYRFTTAGQAEISLKYSDTPAIQVNSMGNYNEELDKFAIYMENAIAFYSDTGYYCDSDFSDTIRVCDEDLNNCYVYWNNSYKNNYNYVIIDGDIYYKYDPIDLRQLVGETVSIKMGYNTFYKTIESYSRMKPKQQIMAKAENGDIIRYVTDCYKPSVNEVKKYSLFYFYTDDEIYPVFEDTEELTMTPYALVNSRIGWNTQKYGKDPASVGFDYWGYNLTVQKEYGSRAYLAGLDLTNHLIKMIWAYNMTETYGSSRLIGWVGKDLPVRIGFNDEKTIHINVGEPKELNTEKNIQTIRVESDLLQAPLYVGRYEVSQKLYKDVMGKNPSYFRGDNLPVEQVSWIDAVIFCNKLSKNSGYTPCYSFKGETNTDKWQIKTLDDLRFLSCNFKANGYRLPTSAEDSTLARNLFIFIGKIITNESYGQGRRIDSGGKTAAIDDGDIAPSGLYNIQGNVAEWTWEMKPYGISWKMNNHNIFFFDNYPTVEKQLDDINAYTNYTGFRVVRTDTTKLKADSFSSVQSTVLPNYVAESEVKSNSANIAKSFKGFTSLSFSVGYSIQDAIDGGHKLALHKKLIKTKDMVEMHTGITYKMDGSKISVYIPRAWFNQYNYDVAGYSTKHDSVMMHFAGSNISKVTVNGVQQASGKTCFKFKADGTADMVVTDTSGGTSRYTLVLAEPAIVLYYGATDPDENNLGSITLILRNYGELTKDDIIFDKNTAGAKIIAFEQIELEGGNPMNALSSYRITFGDYKSTGEIIIKVKEKDKPIVYASPWFDSEDIIAGEKAFFGGTLMYTKDDFQKGASRIVITKDNINKSPEKVFKGVDDIALILPDGTRVTKEKQEYKNSYMYYVVDDVDLSKCKLSVTYDPIFVRKIERFEATSIVMDFGIILTKDVDLVDFKTTTFDFSKPGTQDVNLFFVDYNNTIHDYSITVRKRTRATQDFYDRQNSTTSTFTGFTNITAQAPGNSTYAYGPDFTLKTPVYALGAPEAILPGSGNTVRIHLNGKDPTNYRLNLIGANGTYKAVYYSADYIADGDVENYLKTAPEYISGVTPLPANFYEFYLFVVDNNGKIFRYDIYFPKY